MPEPSTPPFRLYNTLSKRVEPVVPADPARVTFYTCGPTVYDDAHIGNFRSFLAADLLRRWLESPLCTLAGGSGRAHAGPREVVHVMNITDVGHMTDDDTADGSGEDKMAVAGRRIAEAKKSGRLPPDSDVDPDDPVAIARFYETRFREDGRKLGLRVAVEAERDPSLMPRATANVGGADPKSGMIGMISDLIEGGHAYVVGEPGARAVYFDVQRFDGYGQLSGNTLDKLRGGAGGRVSDADQASKRHPADFLLWKEDPAHLMKWDSPWGAGYPGWHIECSVMSLGRLDPDRARHEIDLHSGGEDNIFPHHECERAQSCAATGAPRFARHWFHPRFLMVEGAKMSKSRGTFFTARDLFEHGHEPAAVRLELIKTHYRSNADFSMQGLKDSARRIHRWRRYAKLVYKYRDARLDAGDDVVPHIMSEFGSAMSNDLGVSGALARVDELLRRDLSLGTVARLEDVDPSYSLDKAEAIREIDELPFPAAPMAVDQAMKAVENGRQTLLATWGALNLIDAVLGVIFTPERKAQITEIGVYQGVEPSPEVEERLAARAAARKAKDFAAADAIRDELAGMGLAIKDVAGGKVEVSRA